jgi:surface antigen
VNGYQKRATVREEKIRLQNIDKIIHAREERAYEVDSVLRYYEEVAGRKDARYTKGYVIVNGVYRRLEAFRQYTQQLEAAKSEKSLDCPIDN